MKLSTALRRSTTTAEPKPIAAIRAQLAHKHCADCMECMDIINDQEVDGKPVRWSWESMWALACPIHKPWILVGYDLDYLSWLESQLEAHRDAYKLLQATIDQWDAIYRLSHDMYAEGLITEADYIAELQLLYQSFDPTMFTFNPESLLPAQDSIKVEGQALAQEFARATWHPPVTWT